MGRKLSTITAAVTATLLTVLGGPVQASAGEEHASERDIMSLCKAESTAAGHVMRLRQRGAEMAAVMETVGARDNPDLDRRQRRIVMLAYERPRFSSDEAIQDAVRDFENEQYLDCAQRNGLAIK